MIALEEAPTRKGTWLLHQKEVLDQERKLHEDQGWQLCPCKEKKKEEEEKKKDVHAASRSHWKGWDPYQKFGLTKDKSWPTDKFVVQKVRWFYWQKAYPKN